LALGLALRFLRGRQLRLDVVDVAAQHHAAELGHGEVDRFGRLLAHPGQHRGVLGPHGLGDLAKDRVGLVHLVEVIQRPDV
jgi:hypothetical protein